MPVGMPSPSRCWKSRPARLARRALLFCTTLFIAIIWYASTPPPYPVRQEIAMRFPTIPLTLPKATRSAREAEDTATRSSRAGSGATSAANPYRAHGSLTAVVWRIRRVLYWYFWGVGAGCGFCSAPRASASGRDRFLHVGQRASVDTFRAPNPVVRLHATRKARTNTKSYDSHCRMQL